MIVKAITSALILCSICTNAQTNLKENSINKDVVFEVELDAAIRNKPYLIVYEKGLNNFDTATAGQRKIEPKSSKENTYVFEIKNQSKPLYFSIKLTDSVMDVMLVREFHYEPGDKIRIIAKATNIHGIYDLEFSGTGSVKYRCRNEFKYAMRKDTLKVNKVSDASTYNDDNDEIRYTSLLYKLIEKYKPEMSDYSYQLLHADVLGEMGKFAYSELNNTLINKLFGEKDTVGFKKIAANFVNKSRFNFESNIPPHVLVDSKEYADFLMRKMTSENLMKYTGVNYEALYDRIKEVKSISLRDKMIRDFFMHYWGKINNNFDGILNDALSIVNDKDYLKKIEEFKNNRQGKKAYNFSLTDVNDKKVSLSDFKGKIVFIDFWFTGCTPCSMYYKSVLSNAEKLYEHNPDIVFITISIDKNKDKWVKSVQSCEYTSPKIVNLFTNGEGYNNDVIRYYNIIGYPRPMLIGRDGNILLLAGNQLRHTDTLISEIDKALAVTK